VTFAVLYAVVSGFFHGPRTDDSRAAEASNWMNSALAIGEHGESQLRRTARKIQGHHAAIVGANGIGASEGLRGPPPPTALVSNSPFVRLPAPSAVNLPTAPNADAKFPFPLIPLNVNA